MNTGGGLPRKTISESGPCKFVIRSDKPESRAFQNWETREVLPYVMKHCGYVMGDENGTVHWSQKQAAGPLASNPFKPLN